MIPIKYCLIEVIINSQSILSILLQGGYTLSYMGRAPQAEDSVQGGLNLCAGGAHN